MKHWINKHFKIIVITAFLIPIITVAVVSISHVTQWYGISNPLTWAVYLSVGVEIAALSALAALTANMGKKVYFPFLIVTFIQFIGNVFFSYEYIDTLSSTFTSWVELVSPIVSFIGIESTDLLGHKRILALFTGGLLPVISLSFLHMLVKFTEEERERDIKEDETKNTEQPIVNENIPDIVSEISRVRLTDEELEKLEKILNNKNKNDEKDEFDDEIESIIGKDNNDVEKKTPIITDNEKPVLTIIEDQDYKSEIIDDIIDKQNENTFYPSLNEDEIKKMYSDELEKTGTHYLGNYVLGNEEYPYNYEDLLYWDQINNSDNKPNVSDNTLEKEETFSNTESTFNEPIVDNNNDENFVIPEEIETKDIIPDVDETETKDIITDTNIEKEENTKKKSIEQFQEPELETDFLSKQSPLNKESSHKKTFSRNVKNTKRRFN